MLLFEGRPIPVAPAQTVAAALIAAGIRSWGDYQLFCGIGACHACLVTINGVGAQRACLAVAADGDVVTTEVR